MPRASLLALLAAAWLSVAAAAALPVGAGAQPVLGPPAPADPAAQLVVTPTALTARLPVDGQDDRRLWVGNHGDTTLAFTLTVLPGGPGEGIVPWLDVGPWHGLVAPHTQAALTATFDAAGMAPGLNLAHLIVDSDSPVAPPSVTVPVVLEVVEPWYTAYLPAVSRNRGGSQ